MIKNNKKYVCIWGIVFVCYLIAGCVSDPPYPTQQLEQITVENNEDIISDDEWKSNETHVITTDISVDRAVLRIQPGTRIKFQKNASLTISDSAGLIANGANNNIEFISDVQEKGNWKYILFEDGSIDDSCRLVGCRIEYGGGDDQYPATIICDKAAPTIRGCEIKNSASHGLILEGNCENVQFFNNLITECDLAPITTYACNIAALGSNEYQNNQPNVLRITDDKIERNATWFQQSITIPLLFENGLTINNALLTLYPALKLQFQENQSFTIENEGAIHADGTLDSIWFSGVDDKYWSGIIFKETANSNDSRLINCSVENGGQDDYFPGNISLIESAPDIIGCTFRNSYSFGAYLKGRTSTLNFTNNYFTDNSSGAISLSANSIGDLPPQIYNQPENTHIELRGGNTEQPITSDARWKDLGVDYQINDKIEIEFATVTIDPGITLIMDEYSGIEINRSGGLIADGSSAMITFSGKIQRAGYWEFIYFSPNVATNNCKLINCQIQYGGGNQNFPGMIYCDNSEPVIRNCIIEHSSSYGIYLNGNITISDISTNYFTNNFYGGYNQTP